MVITVARARLVAGQVVDPELPVLTLADLGVLRDVTVDGDGRAIVTITPTYTGCPAIAEMRADLAARLRAAGCAEVDVRIALSPPWTTDWITDDGRRKLAEHGIAPPRRVGARAAGPIPLTLHPPSTVDGAPVDCPRCGSPRTTELSRFSSTACKALRRCDACREPFEHVKEL